MLAYHPENRATLLPTISLTKTLLIFDRLIFFLILENVSYHLQRIYYLYICAP